MTSVSMREMLEAGVHFGHQTKRWDPRMKPYIFTNKNGIYIIDLQKSIEMFKDALGKIEEIASQGGEVLIVGTKKQAQAIIQNMAEEVEMHYIDQRWIGGLLTNFNLVRKSVDKLLELDEMKKDGRWDIKSKKEQSKLEKVYKKLRKSLWGVRSLKGLPALVLIIDTNFEEIAVKEVNRLKIPIVAIVDTNSNPENIDYPIPGNDDAIRSIKLFVQKFCAAYKKGKEIALSNSLDPQEKAANEADQGAEDKEEAVKEEVAVEAKEAKVAPAQEVEKEPAVEEVAEESAKEETK